LIRFISGSSRLDLGFQRLSLGLKTYLRVSKVITWFHIVITWLFKVIPWILNIIICFNKVIPGSPRLHRVSKHPMSLSMVTFFWFAMGFQELFHVHCLNQEFLYLNDHLVQSVVFKFIYKWKHFNATNSSLCICFKVIHSHHFCSILMSFSKKHFSDFVKNLTGIYVYVQI